MPAVYRAAGGPAQPEVAHARCAVFGLRLSVCLAPWYTISLMVNLSNRARGSADPRSGQVMVEYVVVFVAMLAVVSIMALFLYSVRQQSNRTLDLVASEYP